MKALLIVAHGSRRKESNQEVLQLASEVLKQADGQFISTDVAFLEQAEPDIPSAVEKITENGTDHIIVAPYFLAAGRHVVKDIPEIPEILAEVQTNHPEIHFEIKEHIGSSQLMPSLVLQCSAIL